MNTASFTLRSTGFALVTGLLMSTAPRSEAAIIAGDVIVIDFGQSATQTTGVQDPDGTWNNFAPANTFGLDGVSTEATTARTVTSDLLRYADGAGTGVGFNVQTIKSGNGAFHGIGAAAVTPDGSLAFASTGVIPNSAQQDLGYINDGVVIFSLTGLDNSLTYNLQILSKIDVARDPNLWVVNDGLLSEQSQFVEPDASPFIYSFNGIATNGAGIITLTINTPDGGGAGTAHINALEVTAIPEPSSMALVLLSMLAGLWILPHRRS